MRFDVEPSPRGGYLVRVSGADAPLSRHDTEEEAEAAAAAYRRGLEEDRGGVLVRLRDGSEALIRRLEPQDKPLLARAFEQLGDESRYRRFLAVKRNLTVRDLAYFTEIDHADHEAIGAIDPGTGAGLGIARYVRDSERPGAAEAAVTVIDRKQGLGLGGALLAALCVRATENGIDRFTASLLAANQSMLHLFRRLGDVEVRAAHGPVLEIDVDLPVLEAPSLRYALRAAATRHVTLREP